MRHTRLALTLCLLTAVLGACAALPDPGTYPGANSPFVMTCGTQFCLRGHPWTLRGATAYGGYRDPAGQAALAQSAGLNTIEIVEFESQYHVLADTTSEATWRPVDQLIAAARARGQHVVLNLSSYGQSLMAAGRKPTTTDWAPYLRFVTERVNTVTHVLYRDDPTIAMIELYGEIDAPNYSVPLRGTTAETTAFFARTLRELRALDPHHVISTGGFSYLNDPGSGIDWRQILADRQNQTCDIEINSFPDRNITVPEVTDYCRKLGKPWFLAAWSACLGAKWGSDDINHWSSDTQMAAHAQDMFQVAALQNVQGARPTMRAAGADFWNLGNRPIHDGMCDIGQQFPKTFGVVVQHTVVR